MSLFDGWHSLHKDLDKLRSRVRVLEAENRMLRAHVVAERARGARSRTVMTEALDDMRKQRDAALDEASKLRRTLGSETIYYPEVV